jgi:hypothetical protein
MAEAPVAPSARRMPISQVRRATTNAITPYRPINESSSASAPKLPERAARRRSVVSERLTWSSRLRNQRIGNRGSACRTMRRRDGIVCSGAPRTLI